MSSKEQLLSLCVSKLPVQVIDVGDGVEVKIQALKGSDTSRIFSTENMDERIYSTLKKGLIEPVLTQKELIHFIDYAPEQSLTIFTKILELSNALGDAEEEQIKDAKKN